MSSLNDLIRILADGRFHSGEEIGASLGVTRAAVWKTAQQITQVGLALEAVQGRGYRLAGPLELLDETRIKAEIDSASAARIQSLDVLFMVDSTNRYLADREQGGLGSVRICIAEGQTAGRGRRGRTWVSPFGCNVYLSLAWRFSDGPARLSGISLAIAVACARALADLGVNGLAVKWPNDLWWQGKKVAGILLEVSGEVNGPCQVIAGIGINVHMPAHTSIDQDWADVSQIGADVSRNRVAGSVIREVLRAFDSFERDGLGAFRSEWVALDAIHGKAVVLHLPSGTVEGIARGIDDAGALLIETAHGLKRFVSGEISVRLQSHAASH